MNEKTIEDRVAALEDAVEQLSFGILALDARTSTRPVVADLLSDDGVKRLAYDLRQLRTEINGTTGAWTSGGALDGPPGA